MKNQNHLSTKQVIQLLTIANNLEKEIGWTCAGSQNTAFVSLIRICRDYVEFCKRPLAKKEDANRSLLERLDKFYIRYFDKL